MLAAVIAIIGFSILLQPQRHAFGTLLKFINQEWVAGVTHNYPKIECGQFENDCAWFSTQMIAARRIEPLSHESANRLIQVFAATGAALDELEHLRNNMKVRLYFVCACVIAVRLLLPDTSDWRMVDLLIQCLGGILVLGAVFVVKRAVFSNQFWHRGFTEKAKRFVRQILFDGPYESSELFEMLYAERMTGVNLRDARMTLVSLQSSTSAVGDLRLEAKVRVSVTMFDLLAIGGVLLSGGLIPVLQVLTLTTT